MGLYLPPVDDARLGGLSATRSVVPSRIRRRIATSRFRGAWRWQSAAAAGKVHAMERRRRVGARSGSDARASTISTSCSRATSYFSAARRYSASARTASTVRRVGTSTAGRSTRTPEASRPDRPRGHFLTNLGTPHHRHRRQRPKRLSETRLGPGQAGLPGHLQIQNREQRGNGDYKLFVNHMSPGVVPYWHHYLALNWNYGPWSATVTENYQTGTYDEIRNPNTGTAAHDRRLRHLEPQRLCTPGSRAGRSPPAP